MVIGLATTSRGHSARFKSKLLQGATASHREWTNPYRVVATNGPQDNGLNEIPEQVAPRSEFWRRQLDQRVDTSSYEQLLNILTVLNGMWTRERIERLNASDVWFPGTTTVVAAVAPGGIRRWFRKIDTYSSHDRTSREGPEPYHYKSNLWRKIFYGRLLVGVRKESTFRSGALHRTIGWPSLIYYGVGGDAELWEHFAFYRDLFAPEGPLGALETSDNQLSDRSDFRSEFKRLDARRICTSENVLEDTSVVSEALVWQEPAKLLRLMPTKEHYIEASTDGAGWFNGIDRRISHNGA